MFSFPFFCMKFAVFDVDGTLLEMAIPTDFIKWLSERNEFPKEVLDEVFETIKKYGRGEISWEERGQTILNLWSKGFKGKERKEIEELAKEFMESYDKIFPGSVELMNYLKEKDYFLIAISRAFEEILEALRAKLPFDLVIGTKFEVEQGVYTGRLLNELWYKEIKKEILLDLIKEKNLDTKGSFAFGDSDQDAFMMEIAEFPMCIKPTSELNKIAEERKWNKFTEMKDTLDFVKKRIS